MATLAASPTLSASDMPPRRTNIRPWVDFALLSFMLANMTWAMQAAQWSPGLERLLPVVVIAVVAGTLVALGGFGRIFTTAYSVMVGIAAILLSMATLAPDNILAQDRVFYILRRAYLWIDNVISGQPTVDNTVFVLILCVLLWVLAFSAVSTYFRERRKWQAILPTGLAMLVDLYYAPPQLSAYFAIYLFCAILLLVRATLSPARDRMVCGANPFPLRYQLRLHAGWPALCDLCHRNGLGLTFCGRSRTARPSL